MDPSSVSEIVQQERKLWADRVNREAWKFENIERPSRSRMKLASLRQRFNR